jgi:hypothetical protein
MAERTNAQLLKSCEVQASVGSNPTPSAVVERSTLPLVNTPVLVSELHSKGFTRIAGPLRTTRDADAVSSALVDACRLRRGLPPLSVIGSFVVPPLEGGGSRDFQTLHFDFGLPLDPKMQQDVARYTALYVPADVAGVRAVTRLVPLAALMGQRSWPPAGELIDRLTSYGRTHGAWDDDRGYVEGSLARIIEGATAWRAPFLPSV